MGRNPCCSKEGLNRGAWTAQEDQILSDYIMAHGGGKWRSVPKGSGLNRCGKSCRLRWLNYLRPDIKRGNITEDEEELIIRMHRLLGNRWSLIAGRLPGRTDNEIKNYWNTNVVKKLKQNQALSSTQECPSPGKVKNPAKRRKSEGKPRERQAVRATAMRRMDTMNEPHRDTPLGGTEAKKEEGIENVPTDQQDPSQEPLLLPEALEEDLMRDATAVGCEMLSDFLDYELLGFPGEEGIVMTVENDGSSNNNEKKEFAEPNYVFDEALVEELMRVDTCTRPDLPPEMDPLCAFMDPEVGWL